MKYKVTYEEIEGNKFKKIRIDTNFLEYTEHYMEITEILDQAEIPYNIIFKEMFVEMHRQILIENSNFSGMSPNSLNRFLPTIPLFIFILFDNEIDFEKHLEYLLLNELSNGE